MEESTDKKRKKAPWWALALMDLALIAAVLFAYALALGVISPGSAPAAEPAPVPSAAAAAAASPAPAAGATPSPAETEPATWAEKFAEHFTDTVTVTDNSYSDSRISLTIQKHAPAAAGEPAWYAADIYIADIDCFQTYLAREQLTADGRQRLSVDPLELFDLSDAILAISGDFESYSTSGGTVIRNGKVVRNLKTRSDVCVLYRDGRLVCYDGSFRTEDADGEIWQAWTFGPALVENGAVCGGLDAELSWRIPAPRVALGCYEPGHYCFAVTDGRSDSYTDGLTMETWAERLRGLGCETAYNLDGGGSSFMGFEGQWVNVQQSVRQIGDILLITDREAAS